MDNMVVNAVKYGRVHRQAPIWVPRIVELPQTEQELTEPQSPKKTENETIAAKIWAQRHK